MTSVKICGLRRAEDVDYVNEAKPDYIGFIFAKSKREIDGITARELSSRLIPEIKKVGVFVNRDIEELLEIARLAKLDIVQLHGEESEDYIEKIPEKYRVWKAIRVRDSDDIELAEYYSRLEKVEGVLLDAYHESEYGGSGESFDWNLIKEGNFKKLILAGGLDSDNVKDAISKADPDTVDVSSGVETEGYKDFEKIKKFIERVRN
jgi:phosphoribosylanthranilate isomerase